jgi:hypothetical protein
VHGVAGNFMLVVDIAGTAAPADLYGQLPAQGQEYFWGLVKRNDELEKKPSGENRRSRHLEALLAAVRKSFTESSDEKLDRGQFFSGDQTTVRRVYLRQLVHTHEHMGN